jgi:DNA polymerase
MIEAHGGVTTENIVQALTRDILKVGLQRLHKAGFHIVGHSHDEAIAIGRVGDNHYTWETMREIMSEPIEWALGFPLGGSGWSGAYYRK